ncbi:translation initiation factor IF-2 [Desulfohalobium retbaense]|uniref:Translation initiation factor IF-2 n=1 Tax=Desulfohalobium retbaense (strain ATCC 49708 / DSM 5692 / JCM 16813 / HR100) TaxID=485915 RepID=C8X0G7_DESRD|nr:translation initiation factor IF-2 [Desulfohalobium retbaense]ACV67792.1 translation initiation factor IF-2 [Desulfohalobium retbaense DSM 5692]
MTTKMRVRELSNELGLSNKELLHLLRELGIQVKSHMSGLSDDEVDQVRQRFHAGSQSQDSVQKRTTRSGVIVRRRRRAAKSESEPEPQPAEEPEAEPEAAAEAAAAEPQPEPAPTARIVEPPHADEEPEEGEPEAEEPEAEEPQHPEETTQAEPAQDTGVAQEPQETEETIQEQPAEDSEEPSETEAGKKKKKKRKKKPESPAVKVISKPEVTAEEPAPSPAPAEAADTEAASKKKKKKDKRVVDFSSTPAEAEPQDKRKASTQWKKKKSAGVKDKTGGKERRPGRKRQQQGGKAEPVRPTTQPTKASKRKIKIDEAIRLGDLARQLGVKVQELIKSLMQLGIMATINQSLDIETATVLAEEFGYEVEKVGFSEDEFILPKEEDNPEALEPRWPVVTIMGHVDHGKTSLLDAIRESKITTKEAGGITQHIGAYYVGTDRGELVFLDTPGHEAFTAMRARGAQVTDIVILVVAADDGVMDQTREAINHSKAAGVPLIVAVNKMDKENADPERVKRELAEFDLVPEEWGGDTIYAYVSAKSHSGLDDLLEMVLLQAEVQELKANPAKRARGHIVEAKLDKGRGAVGTVLVQEGTLHHGDAFVCGLYHGKVRALFNDRGKNIKSAGPSMPVEVQGFDGVPEAGDEFVAVQDDKVARRIAEERQTKQREKDLAKETKVTLESFMAAKADEEVKSLNLVIKADVQGSLEACIEAVRKLSTDEVKVEIIHGGTGSISESDIMLASASSAVLIGFNVRPTARIKDIAEQEKVDIRFYDVIYQMVNEVKDAMAGMLAPVVKEVYLGQAEVRDTFSVPKVGTVAGCMVVDGKLQRNAHTRLLRDGVVIYTGKIDSLKRFKDDAKEVQKGFECGVGLENFNDIKSGDIIEAFEEVQEKATLD